MAELHVRVDTFHTQLNFALKRRTTGQQLCSTVAGLLGLQETSLFGLQFVDRKGTETWMGASETLDSFRFRKESPLHIQFMVRFWPGDVAAQVSEQIAQTLLFLQVQAAVETGELLCPFSTAAQLAAYSAQVRCGDFNEGCRQSHYRKSIVPPAVAGAEASLSHEAHVAWKLKVACLHKKLRGLSQQEALEKYFQLAQELPSYGVTYFDVVTERGDRVWLGVTADGIGVFEQKLTPKFSFSWADMSIHYNGRKLIIKRPCRHIRKLVFHTAREQVSMDILALASGYNRLKILRKPISAPAAPPGGVTPPLPSPGHSSSRAAESSESAVPSPAVSSRSDSSGFGEDRLSLTRSEVMSSNDSMTSATREGRAPEAAGGSGVRAPEAAGGVRTPEARCSETEASDCDCDYVQRLVGAATDRLTAGNTPRQPASDTDDDSAGSGAELNCATVYLNVTEATRGAPTGFVAGMRHSNRFESSLSLSVLDSWGPFLQSLMVPD